MLREKGVANSILLQQSLKLMSNLLRLGGGPRAICPGMRHTAYNVIRTPPLHATRMPLEARGTTSTCQSAECHCRRRGVGLRRGVAGDVVLLLIFGSDSSVVDNVFGVLPFFPFPFVDVHRSDKPCITIFQLVFLLSFESVSMSTSSESTLWLFCPCVQILGGVSISVSTVFQSNL